MASEDKLNFELRRHLKNIDYRNIPFNPAEAAENFEVVERTMKGVFQSMKEVDPLFQELCQRFVYSSSYHEKICIKRAEEFDLNVLVRLPFQSEDIETCMPEEAAAFVTYRLKRDATSILDHDRKWTPELYQKLPEFFDDNLYLLRSRVQQWLQNVIEKTWQGRKFPQMLKRQSESCSTFVISFKKRKLLINVVPVIEGHPNVPPRGLFKSDRFMQLKQSNQAKGKNRQNIHRKTQHPNTSRGRPQYYYTPRGHGNHFPARVFPVDALDSDGLPHRPPPKLHDYVPNSLGEYGSQDDDFDQEDQDDKGYNNLRERSDSCEKSDVGGRGRGGRERRDGGGGWQIAGPKRLSSRFKYSPGDGNGGFRCGGGVTSIARSSHSDALQNKRQSPSFLPVHSWYLVPKLHKQQNMGLFHEADDFYWRISFPEAEKRLLHNTGCLPTLIRLFKFLRNQQNWSGLPSYSIKTLFVEEFDSLDVGSDYWMDTKLGTLFLDLLDTLTYAIRNRCIPHYFNREANLLESLNEQTSENIASYLDAMSNDIRRNPKMIFKHFAC